MGKYIQKLYVDCGFSLENMMLGMGGERERINDDSDDSDQSISCLNFWDEAWYRTK